VRRILGLCICVALTRHRCTSFSPAEEIGSYFQGVAKRNGLYPLITFNSAVVGATWDEPSGKWRVRVSRSSSPGTPTNEEEHNADVVINAGGILNDWKWPDIKGLDTFRGRLLHTAAWVRSWSPTPSAWLYCSRGKPCLLIEM
jgi:cation diffusion facilitator CzcD-associated flavoprotein CzcO